VLNGKIASTRDELWERNLERKSRDGWQRWTDSYGRLNLSISAPNTSWFIASLVLCMGIATPSHAQAIQPVPPTPIDVKKVELGGTPWNPQWDQIIEKALPPGMLSSQVPRDVRRFCPRFYEMGESDKRTFWAYFFQALAGAEAGLNPNKSVRHSEREDAMTTRSEGLLQLAYGRQQALRLRFQLGKGPSAKSGRSGKSHSHPEEQLMKNGPPG
jgi:hypothetical protein